MKHKEKIFSDIYISKLIQLWNNDRLEMYVIKPPDRNGIFYGVVRLFYTDFDNTFQSKCMKVSSTTTTLELKSMFVGKINSQIEPHRYSLFVVNFDGNYEVLNDFEYVLLIQLTWAEEEREKRFMIKLNSKVNKKKFTRTFMKQKSTNTPFTPLCAAESLTSIESIEKQIKELYRCIPDGPLTSGITSHNAVIERKRNQKFALKVKEFLNSEEILGTKQDIISNDGKPKLGTLKVFATSIFPQTPYKTIIISIYDNARSVIREALCKFIIGTSDIDENSCYLTMVVVVKNDKSKKGKHIRASPQEFAILDDDKPLELYNSYNTENRVITFHLRRKIQLDSAFCCNITEEARSALETLRCFAVLAQLDINDSKKPNDHPCYISVGKDIIAIGSNSYSVKSTNYLGHPPTQTIILKYQSIHPLHCIIARLDRVLSITPSVMDADISVNCVRVYETTPLIHGSRVSIGGSYHFEVHIPTKTSGTMGLKEVTESNASDHWVSQINSLKKSLPSPITKIVLLPLQIKFDKSAFNGIFLNFASLLHERNIKFKLSSSYVMYLALIAQFENCTEEAETNQSSDVMGTAILEFQKYQKIAYKILDDFMIYYSQPLPNLLLWLGNIPELHNFLRQDFSLSAATISIREFLSQSTRILLNEITQRLENNLKYLIGAFYLPFFQDAEHAQEFERLMNFDPLEVDNSWINDQYPSKIINEADNNSSKGYFEEFLLQDRHPHIYDIIMCLNEWLALFCKHYVNPSFTVQIMTRLFSFMAKYLVDEFVSRKSEESYASVKLGEVLKVRFNIFRIWSESQGLELIFDKEFEPLMQMLKLINAPKNTLEETIALVSHCSCLNSKQIENLFKQWQKTAQFENVRREWLNEIVKHAESFNDSKNDLTGNLKLAYTSPPINPCLVTCDGYFSENNFDFSEAIYCVIQSFGDSRISIFRRPETKCGWSSRFKDVSHAQTELTKSEYIITSIVRHDSSTIGMKLVSVNNQTTKNRGIYISQIYPKSIANTNGNLSVGDQLISVNDCLLTGVNEFQAAEIINKCGSVLKFEILKRSAEIHGIDLSRISSNSKKSTPLSKNSIEDQNSQNSLPHPTSVKSQQNFQQISQRSFQEMAAASSKHISSNETEDDHNTEIVQKSVPLTITSKWNRSSASSKHSVTSNYKLMSPTESEKGLEISEYNNNQNLSENEANRNNTPPRPPLPQEINEEPRSISKLKKEYC